MATALITGATSGIGLSFTRQLAGHGHDIVLVARNEERLGVVAAELERQFNVAVQVLPADLSSLDGCNRVAQRLTDAEAPPVEWLINNAGFGVSESFAHSDLEAEQAMLDVLITAPMRLTHAALPGMLDRGRGRIVVVSSVAGFVPGGTYSAAKDWATVFAESLSARYASQGVHVTALCPGFTHTEFHQRAEMDVSNIPEWLWKDADAVAEAGLRGCSQGRAVVVPGGVYKGLRGLAGVLPRPLVRRIMSRA